MNYDMLFRLVYLMVASVMDIDELTPKQQLIVVTEIVRTFDSFKEDEELDI